MTLGNTLDAANAAQAIAHIAHCVVISGRIFRYTTASNVPPL